MPHRMAVVVVVAAAAAVGCSDKGRTPVTKSDPPIQTGGLYAARSDDGTWRVSKVLAVDDAAVHVRMYANKFAEQPADVDPATLTLGGLNDPAGFGIGHAPLTKEGFLKDRPVLLKVVPVREDELDGYRLYLEAMKGGR